MPNIAQFTQSMQYTTIQAPTHGRIIARSSDKGSISVMGYALLCIAAAGIGKIEARQLGV